MSAIAQLRQDSPGSSDPAVLLAAIQAFSESLAIVASGRIVYANPAWCGLFECEDDSQLQGRELEDFVPSHPLAVVPALTDEQHEANAGAQFSHVRRDGSRAQIELACASFRLRGCDFQVLHTRDVSRQKQIEKQLREAQTLESLGRLVGGVAHDFNNLLTGIMLYCDLLMGELEKDSLPQRHVREMRTAGEHGAALVQQLLAVARPPAEEASVFIPNDVVIGIAGLLARLVGENIGLDMSLAPDLGAVRMDPARVQQILLNLALNARDAMPDGGRIKISTRNFNENHTGEAESKTASWVEFAVSDNGCGMDAETLDRAFEPFFTTKKPGRGNGLGLATARRLARQEGGNILAESQPGKGTRIFVRLPRVQAESIKFESKEVIS